MAKRLLEIKREYEGLEEDETEDEVGESENDEAETVDYCGGGGAEEVKEDETEDEVGESENDEAETVDYCGGGGAEEVKEEEEEEVEERPKRVLLRMVSRQRGEVPTNTLCCQVDDCGADLRAAKRYHRRHKVCERHAKAVFVFVGGVEQRFCQQCSRFHGICQFDDTKRSCRKRLAGHNQRRRKNQPEPPTEDRQKPELSDYDEISIRGNSNRRHFRIR